MLGVLGVPPPNSLRESALAHPQLKKGVGGCWGCWGVLGRLGNPSPRRPSLAIRGGPHRPPKGRGGPPSPGPPPDWPPTPPPPTPADRGLRTGGLPTPRLTDWQKGGVLVTYAHPLTGPGYPTSRTFGSGGLRDGEGVSRAKGADTRWPVLPRPP